MSWPGPRWSTASSIGRPLIALWMLNRKVPAPGTISFRVSQCTRIEPLTIVNASVCALPRPDHEPSDRHRTIFFESVGGSDGALQPLRTTALQPVQKTTTKTRNARRVFIVLKTFVVFVPPWSSIAARSLEPGLRSLRRRRLAGPANGALHQIPHQRDLVAVVAQRRRARDRQLARHRRGFFGSGLGGHRRLHLRQPQRPGR